MRYLIVSDIHANWQALQAVLAAAKGQYDQILCCGDLVGYGADPNRVVDWARQEVTTVIRGNHDRASAFAEDLEWFTPVARTSTLWTRSTLTAPNRQWLQQLPRGPVAVGDFQLIHGSPRDEDEYVVSLEEFRSAFQNLTARIAFFGHTHLQCGCSWYGGRYIPQGPESRLDVRGEAAWLINPGAVGQPRDGDPRAAYALFDTTSAEVSLMRADYDINAARSAILDAGLPARLGDRLLAGS